MAPREVAAVFELSFGALLDPAAPERRRAMGKKGGAGL
jgi:hypothetical protein